MLTWARRATVVAVMSGLAAIPAMAQQGMGGDSSKPLLSPRDTARATVADAHLLVDYGRPSKRGREIFGTLVPFDAVWRTGANAATTFVTDKDLVIGGTAVPAGTYTIYTLPSKSDWKLIINKQTKQWGTEYHQDQDLARIPMTVTAVSPSVEKFLIAIVPGDNGGTLEMTWDTTKASVPFTVK